MDTGELKASIVKEIDSEYGQLAELSRKLHDNPEVAFEEFKAADWISGYLEKRGFVIERGICELPTAFRGIYGSEEPTIAILAEYDALPKLGHACGHNLIATGAVAAGIASKLTVDELGGSITVIGTPGEELYGGKAIMAGRGAFDSVDMAMIVHPGGGNTVVMPTLACQTLEVEFFGRAAHASAEPEAGINALEALLQSFAAINSLRQHIRDKSRIHGIITNGGEAANIVPAHTAASFIVRAENDSYLDELKEKVINCFSGAALATGAELKYSWGEVRYAAMLDNMNLARLFRNNLTSLGQAIKLGHTAAGWASTDVGNVSQLVPTIQAIVGIAPSNVLVHTPQFADVAATEHGLRRILNAAKAMAMTVVDILSDKRTAERIREEFRKEKRTA